MYGCQQILLNPVAETKAILEYICGEANKVYNCGLYLARQIYFKSKRTITKYELEKQLQSNLHFKALYSHVAQQTLRSVYESMKSYQELWVKFRQGKLDCKPRLPHYRKPGLYQVAYPGIDLKLKKRQIRVGYRKQTKIWFGVDSLYLPMPSNLEFKQIKELRIIPRNNCFYLELVYKVEEEKINLDPDQVLGIDHGVNNWLTCVSNVDTSFIVDGLHLKSMNNWYNKQVASIKEKKPKGFWSQKLSRITEKRNRQVRDGVNKAARMVINHCLEHKIGTIIFGWNEGQKKEAKMGRKTNQRFVQIPTGRLKERIKQLASRYGIRFIETEESYTSIASFLDGDFLPKYGEKPQEWKSSGRRVKRGLFRSQKNHYLNADANGASNIIRKVSTKLKILKNVSLDGVSMGSLTAPQRIKIWSAKKTRSNADLSRCVVSA